MKLDKNHQESSVRGAPRRLPPDDRRGHALVTQVVEPSSELDADEVVELVREGLDPRIVPKKVSRPYLASLNPL